MIAWLAARTQWFRPIEDVCREIDEELEFHLDQRTAANLESGMAYLDAARVARESFGNPSAIRAELIRIATRPRRIAAMVVSAITLCLLIGVAVVVSGLREQGRLDTAELTRIGGEVTALRAAVRDQQGRRLAPAQSVHMLEVTGAVARERLWVIPFRQEITLAALIEKSGGLTVDATGRVFLTDDAGEVVVCDLGRIRSGDAQDPLLTKSMAVLVEISSDRDSDEDGP